MRMREAAIHGVWFCLAVAALTAAPRAALAQTGQDDFCVAVGERRTICADVAAIDQTMVYNRFGTFNPFGMMYALRRDLTDASAPPAHVNADDCGRLLGTETSAGEGLTAGNVRLKDCKRPRPLVLRANVGDILHLRLTNLLREEAPGFSNTFCRQEAPAPAGTFFHKVRKWVSEGDQLAVAHGEAQCLTSSDAAESSDRRDDDDLNWPASRGLNFAIQGLTAVGPSGDPALSDEVDPACIGLAAIPPNDSVDCYYLIDREGPYFLASTAAPSGGQGDGGSLTHGLFGAVVAEKADTSWYRSQVTAAAFEHVWHSTAAAPHARDAAQIGDPGRYEAMDGDGAPVLNMLRPVAWSGADCAEGAPGCRVAAAEIVHADLNAIVYRPAAPEHEDESRREGVRFREFSVFFHDEVKAFYTRNFEELSKFEQLAGVGDGFAINYGASGMGAMLLANRKGIGPSATCMECLYEEFFLTSWVNGDPALLENYADDPSGVHHSYLNDEVVFRNFHAGPKETHVFHLHAHQWFSGNDENRGSFLDSQTVGPQQGFSYNIYHGGLRNDATGEAEAGWWGSLGSGNRNRTVGDSIFHCHLYPHFAQGMWELWRVHDVLEDGTRKLPDGQAEPELSLAEISDEFKTRKRPGSVHTGAAWTGEGTDPNTGRRIRHADHDAQRLVGTPIPALVPLPGQAWPLLPTYPDGEITLTADGATVLPEDAQPVEEVVSTPGYPFYIAGQPGHRAPQPPMDIARQVAHADAAPATDIPVGAYLDAGLPRHVVTDAAERSFPISLPAAPVAMPDGVSVQAEARENDQVRQREQQQAQVVAKTFAMADLTADMVSAKLALLDYDGTPLERAAMGFHHDGRAWRDDGANRPPLDLRTATGAPARFYPAAGGYGERGEDSEMVAGSELFFVNGAPPKPGAPFADPCGAPAGAAPSWGVDETGGDPFVGGFPSFAELAFTSDPRVSGYRRYEGSAVQLDMVTNRAGWHDPQARINVLTRKSDVYKTGGGRISPYVSATEEPFFFRALSGECIEFRHTNELPKKLELDDFQVKTPTDTIGQHIHLVKFDVTSSDGSANGFNYEDGTFAPDEISMRICAAMTAGMEVLDSRAPGELGILGADLCEAVEGADGQPVYKVKDEYKDVLWKKARSTDTRFFQTTVQRWFADPILSPAPASAAIVAAEDAVEEDDPLAAFDAPVEVAAEDPAALFDRTMRTVFSHDHFGPSSIQQHGFYSALVVEPAAARISDPRAGHEDWTAQRSAGDRSLQYGIENWVGASKVLHDPESLDPEGRNYREFALAIADFATLYDPRDADAARGLLGAIETGAGGARTPKGLETLYCEAYHARRAARSGSPARMAAFCGSALEREGARRWSSPGGDVPPAWLAAGMPGDSAHAGPLLGNLLTEEDVEKLRAHLLSYRNKAAGFAGEAPGAGARLARPVAPPARPEAISVDHHDPYLVNYRGEPLPLRLGRSSSGACLLKASPEDWVGPLQTGVGHEEDCTVSRQRAFPEGDPANVFLSSLHGDPATPVFETYSSDRVLFRLIQGAQEVQHTFNLEGYNWPRNIDQRFASGMPPIEDATPVGTLSKTCERRPAPAGGVLSRDGRPRDYAIWLREGLEAFEGADRAFWEEYERYIAACPNAEGRISAQEVGISEHFEFAGAYRSDANFESRFQREVEDPEGEQRLNSLTPTDTLLHFGSVDALWNGGWGLLRVYPETRSVAGEHLSAGCLARTGSETADAASIADCLEADATRAIGNRLRALADPATTASDGQEVADAEDGHAIRTGATPALLGCDPAAPRVHAAAVAIETRRAFRGPLAGISDEGTPYGGGLYDRNGIFLAMVDPRRIARPRAAGEDMESWLLDPAAWRGVDTAEVVRAVGEAYARPEPYVLNVRAGDCVYLTVINALQSHGATGGLKDDLGDARMPKITSLNVEPDWRVNLRGNLPLRAEQNDSSNLRPSARFGLLTPLPTLNHRQIISQPFGWNRTGALAPGDAASLSIEGESPWGQSEANIEQISFYAGRVGVPLGFDPVNDLAFSSVTAGVDMTERRRLKEHQLSFAQTLKDRLAPAVRAAFPEEDDADLFHAVIGVEFGEGSYVFNGNAYRILLHADGLFAANGQPRDFMPLPEIFARIGELTEVDVPALEADVVALWSGYADQLFRNEVHWIPYAFGPLPLRSSGDMIGHGVHGLFGAVVVHPQNSDFAVLADGQQLAQIDGQGAACDPASRANCAYVAGPPEGAPFMPWVASHSVATRAESRIREFTLFWQDGLNLRDERTRDRWLGRDTSSGVARWPRLVADCAVCDDSYDWGEVGVNYRSAPFHRRLSEELGAEQAESHYNLNAYDFGNEFFAMRRDETGEGAAPEMVVLRAAAGEEVVINVVHPGGRARQRAFVTIAQDYDDLFPGFGFPHSALLAPGKALRAALTRSVQAGCYIWFEGATQLWSGGVWGLLDVVSEEDMHDLSRTSCERRERGAALAAN